jgi:hypothetical protein
MTGLDFHLRWMVEELSRFHSVLNLKQYLKQEQRDMTPIQPTILVGDNSSYSVVLPGDEFHEMFPGGNHFLFCLNFMKISHLL